jgi:hypothetical protein
MIERTNPSNNEISQKGTQLDVVDAQKKEPAVVPRLGYDPEFMTNENVTRIT